MPASCKQSGCPLAQTGAGTCLENFVPPSSCPHYLAESMAATAPPAVAPASPQISTPKKPARAPDDVELPAGTAFDPSTVYEVAREGLARVVILAGEQRSGKTTLISSLYELFQEGVVGRFSFAGSKTLPAFEERCHDARMTSGREIPDTERTKPGEGFRFLHLALLDREAPSRTNLLLGDMSGELYDAVRDSSDECAKYEFLRRADHFVVMLNGAKLANNNHAETYAHARGVVRSLVDADVLRGHTHVTLLTTKWDLIVRSGDRAQARVTELEESFRTTFASKLPQVHFAHVAARPENADLDFAFGLNDLLNAWMDKVGLAPPPRLNVVASEREFDRLRGARP
jgi:hypothetical protein